MSEPVFKYDDKKGTITVTIDVSEEALETAPPSKTGKSKLISSTHGNVRVGPVQIGMNVYMRQEKEAAE